jgi:hypothetical protein
MNIQIKEGTKDSQGRVVQLGDTLDCFGYFTRDGNFHATRITVVEEDKRDAN